MSDDLDEILDEHAFKSEIGRIGILSIDSQDNLWQLAKHCARTTGLPMAVGTGLLGAAGGATVSVGTLTVPGWAVGFLVGLAVGTASCMSLSVKAREKLRTMSRARI